MFSWICPTCGAEVAPSYSDCPHCAAKTATPPQQPSAPPPPPPPPQPLYAPPPAHPQWAPPPAQPQYAPPPQQYAAQPQYVYVKQGPPGWLVTLGVALGLVGIGGVAYTFMHRGSSDTGESKSAAEKSGAKGEEKSAATGKVAKFLEVSGIRMLEEKKKTVVRVSVVNHSSAELSAIEGTITLKAVGAKGEPTVVASFPFKLDSLGGYSAKDVQGPLETTLRAYEMPDWQFLRADLLITSP